MTTTRTLSGSLAAALVAALSIAAGTATATSPPTITAGQGCSVQCISKAAVTANATSAKVELATTVPANLKVTVGKQLSGGNGGLVANQAKTVNVSAYSPLKTAFFLNLEADTTYAISVRATDLQGRSSVRSGTFKTPPYKTTGHSGSNTFDTGVGCSQQCITKALVSQKQPDGTSARIEIKTSTTAHIQIDVSLDKPVQTSVGLVQYEVVSRQWTGADTKSWTPQITGLEYGTKYYVVVRARDAQGRVSMRQGSFRTVSATATITFDRIKVLNDGDKVGKGELFFNLWFNGDWAWGTGLRKLSSGDTTNVNPSGSSRPGLPIRISANGDAEFTVEMLGEECDELSKKNCVLETHASPGATFPQWALATGHFDVSDLLKPGTLPGWYGTGVTPPAGHDGYFTFATTDHYVKFLVLATIDLDVDWP